MNRTIPALFAALLLLIGAPLPVMADVGVSVEFSDEEIRIIGAWYENHDPKAGRGGGKHKHKGLPPGIAKNLARGKRLAGSGHTRNEHRVGENTDSHDEVPEFLDSEALSE